MDQLDIKKTKAVVCEKCNNDTFIQVCKLRLPSKLQAATNGASVIIVPLYSCTNCGHVNKDFDLHE